MFNILIQPYPFVEKSRFRIIIQSCLEGTFVAFFLILFQPFSISNFTIPYKYLYLVGYGLVTCCAGLILRFGFFKVFRNFFTEKKWTITKEIFTIFLLISIITLLNFVYTVWIFELSFSFTKFGNMFLMVLIIGVFPTVFGVMLNYIVQLKKYNQNIILEPILTFSETNPTDVLKLTADNEKDFLEINQKDFLYIESSDNYSTIYFSETATLKKHLIRSSLSRLENQISFKNIARTHRSYLANMNRVIKISGNAQGYKLHLDTHQIIVPVARKYAFLVENLK
jgi:hypothetical protein